MLAAPSTPAAAQGHALDCRHVDVDSILLGVDGDGIAILHQRNRATFLRFGSNVADDESVGATRESTVRHQRDVAAEPSAHDG